MFCAFIYIYYHHIKIMLKDVKFISKQYVNAYYTSQYSLDDLKTWFANQLKNFFRSPNFKSLMFFFENYLKLSCNQFFTSFLWYASSIFFPKTSLQFQTLPKLVKAKISFGHSSISPKLRQRVSTCADWYANEI